MVSAIFLSTNSRASRAWARAWRMMSTETPLILMSICSEDHYGDMDFKVAVVVLAAHDVREDADPVPLLDQAHGDARDGCLERHAGVHERHGSATHRGHGGRAVGLEDVGDDADRVG